METRILVPEQLIVIIAKTTPSRTPSTDSKTRLPKSKVAQRNSSTEKLNSSRIELIDSETEEKTPPPDFSSSESSSSDESSSRDSSGGQSQSSDTVQRGRTSSFTSDSDSVVSSDDFIRRNKNKNKSEKQKRKEFRKIVETQVDDVKICAKQRIPCGAVLCPNDGDVQIISISGVDPLVHEDIRFAFGCFDRVTPDPENPVNKIRLCNWIRFVRRSFNSFDTRVNLLGKYVKGQPVLEFTKEINPDEELVAFFDVTSLSLSIKRELGDPTDELTFSMTTKEDDNPEAPLDLSKSPSPPKPKPTMNSLKSSDEDEVQSHTTSPGKLSNSFSIRNVLQPAGMKLFQPHLYSPPTVSSLSTSTLSTKTASLSSPTNTNSALNSPNCNSMSMVMPSHLNLLGNGSVNGLLRPILRTRGRERSLLPCDVCGKAFDRPSLLKRHMRTHTGEKPHICDVCNKGFSTSSSLNTHRRIHSGEKPHQCPMCGKRFTASSNLYYHKMTHNKEKPHKCLLCGKSFPTPGDLKSHQYVHSGSWPYNCPICHRGFSKQTNLRNHLLLHSGTGDKPHSCQICGKKFALACNLRAHVRTHEEDPVTSCSSCKRTFLTSLNMLVDGQCRSCLLHVQTARESISSNVSNGNNQTSKNSQIIMPMPMVKIESQPDVILPSSPALLHGFHHPGIFHDSLGFNANGRPNPFLEQLFEWNWRFAKETAGNLGLMQQKLLESQMLAAHLMNVSNTPGISDLLKFRPPGLPHSGDFNALDGSDLSKFTP